MRAAFDALGGHPPGLQLACRNAIPHAPRPRLVVGRDRRRRPPGPGPGRGRRGPARRPAAFQLAAALEGHPDNVAAACFGGLTVAGTERRRLSVAPDPGASPGVRDGRVRPADAALDRGRPRPAARRRTARRRGGRRRPGRAAGRCAGDRLAGQLLRGDRATGSHQDYRRPAMPESLALVDALRAAGHAAVVPVPARRCWCSTAGHADLASYTPDGAAAHRPLEVAADGVRVALSLPAARPAWRTYGAASTGARPAFDGDAAGTPVRRVLSWRRLRAATQPLQELAHSPSTPPSPRPQQRSRTLAAAPPWRGSTEHQRPPAVSRTALIRGKDLT